MSRHPHTTNTRALFYSGARDTPAAAISLRAIDPERYAIVNEDDGDVIEEIEESKAFYAVYDGAVYMFQVLPVTAMTAVCAVTAVNTVCAVSAVTAVRAVTAVNTVCASSAVTCCKGGNCCMCYDRLFCWFLLFWFRTIQTGDQMLPSASKF